MMCPKRVLKNSDILWESTMPHACSGLCAYPGRTKNILISHHWQTLRLWTNRKLKLRQSYKLPVGTFKTGPTHSETRSKGWETYPYKAFKEISVQSQADQQTNREVSSVIRHNKEHRLYMIIPGKSQTKKMPKIATTRTSKGKGNLISKITTLYYFKCPLSNNKKSITYSKK